MKNDNVDIGIYMEISVRHPLDDNAISDCLYFRSYKSVIIDNKRDLEQLVKDCNAIINRYKISDIRERGK